MKMDRDRLVTVGLDLSLTSPAAVAYAGGNEPLGFCNPKSTSDEVFEERINRASTEILRFVKRIRPNACLLEAQLRSGKYTDLRAVQCTGVIRWRLWRRGFLIAEVSSGTVKKFATGSGRADKKAMVSAAREIWPACPNHDVADAFHMARLLYSDYGRFIDLGE